MPDTQPVLPALKPNDWPGRDHALCRPLVQGHELPNVPWVGYGYNHPHSFEFITQESIPGGNQNDQVRLIEQAALRNLRERSAHWKLEKVRLGLFQTMPLLMCTEDFLAAERILDAQSMQEAAQKLRAAQLIVGVPCRGVLVATNARLPEQMITRFSAMVSAQFYSPQNVPISPTVFVVEEGKIVGAITGLEEIGQKLARASEQQAPEVYLNAVISADRQTGSETLQLLAGCPDFERLAHALLPAFVQGVEQMLQRSEFNGQVQIVLVPERTPRTPDLAEKMDRLQNHFRGVAAESHLVTKTGKPLQVSVVYGLAESGERKSPPSHETSGSPGEPSNERGA